MRRCDWLLLAVVLSLATPTTPSANQGPARESGRGLNARVDGMDWNIKSTSENKVEEEEEKVINEKKNEEGQDGGKKRKKEEEVLIKVVPSLSPKKEEKKKQGRGREETAGGGKNISLELVTKEESFILDLHPNRELLGNTYKGVGGKQVWCDYQGNVRGYLSSLVAVSVCEGLRGVLVVHGRWLQVSPAPTTHSLLGPHLLAPLPSIPGLRRDQNHYRQQEEEEEEKSVIRRRVERSLRGDRLWVQPNTSYVELMVAVDHKLYSEITNKSASSSVSRRVQAITNVLNMLYKPLGIIIVLTHLEEWKEADKVELVPGDSTTSLTNLKPYLSTFRSENPDITVDNLQLLTAVGFEESVAGRATVEGLCGPNSVGMNMDRPTNSILATAELMAHELGHNFGLPHVDEVDQCGCEEENCIMYSKSKLIGAEWHECSRKKIASLVQTAALDCLRNKPVSVAKLDEEETNCGNGVREEGEECDCGPAKYCDNRCCNADTCTLAVNATCATGPCCDVKSCQPFTSSLVECRAAFSECDSPEYCDGRSEECPDDGYVRDGTACDGYEGYCYQGRCGNPGRRCVQVWGEGASVCSAEHAKKKNVFGQRWGNCGYKYDGEELKACEESNAECGTLFCQTGEKPDVTNYFEYSVWKDSKSCMSVYSNMAYPQSIWLVPDGSPCGNGQMCVNQECVSRPLALATIIFIVVVVLSLLLTCLLWDHIRHRWEKQGGRECCHTHLYYCAACLDTFVFPCMNRVNRLMLAVLPPLTCSCGRFTKTPEGREGTAPPRESRPDNGCSWPGGASTGEQREQRDEVDVGWGGRLEFMNSAPKGVSFTPLSPPDTTPTLTRLPLLHTPNQDSPPTPGVGTREVRGGVVTSLPPPAPSSPQHTKFTPARPAPAPPPQHPAPPIIPPRPVTTQPLRPPLPSPHPTPPLVPQPKPPLPPKP